MGKASRWFRGLLGLKKSSESSSTSQPLSASTTSSHLHPKPPKKKWSFKKSSQDQQHHHHHNAAENTLSANATFVDSRLSSDTPSAATQPSGYPYAEDPNGHAIAVATATAAVADAAVAAARATAADVWLTSSSGRSTPMTFSGMVKPAVDVSGSIGIREWAAVKIQSHFRSYLARRALRALKALVRVQALVRGHIMRKQTADAVRTLQAVLRVQAHARARRVAQVADTPRSVTKSSYLGPVTPEKYEYNREKSTKCDRSLMLKRNSSKTNGRVTHDRDKAQMGRKWLDYKKDEGFLEDVGTSMTTSLHEGKNDKVIEVYNGKSHITPKRKSLFQASHLSLGSDQYSHSFTTSKGSVIHHRGVPSVSSGEVQSMSPLKFAQNDEESSFCTADNSPQFFSVSSEGGSSTKGVFNPSKSYGSRSCLSGYLDYPSYMAYTESAKAKLRSVSAPKQRPQFERSSSTNGFSVHGYNDTSYSTQRVSTLHSNFTSKAYPGSGRLDRLGMPLQSDVAGFSGGHWIRY